MWIPNNTILQQLKCFTCKNYISVGPVTQTTDGYNCGRCSANGNDISTPFKVFAENSLFPCIYDANGCKAKVAYGEEVINHEKVCEYRFIPCPVLDSCECGWNGPSITSYEHCLNEHKECIVEGNEFEFNVNLRESVNKKCMMKRKNGEVLLLHLLYSEEMGLSVNIKLFVFKHQKRILRYTLALQSSAGKTRMELESREIIPFYCFKSLEWIPFNILCYLNKATVSVTIKFERNQNPAVSECDNCDHALPLYILTCARNHRFCSNCCNIEQNCIICNDCLQIRSNYSAMETEGGIFGCCNAEYVCSFLSNLAGLQEHEEKCVSIKCLVKTCQWRGVESNFSNHLKTHQTTANGINIEIEKIEDNTYFVLLAASCSWSSHNRTHYRGLFIVQILVDDTKNAIKLLANYSHMSSPATEFSKGKIQVTFDNSILYEGDIGKMTGVVFDRSGEIQFCRSFLKRHKVLTITLVDFELKCVNRY